MSANWFNSILEKFNNYKWVIIIILLALGKFLNSLQNLAHAFNDPVIKSVYIILAVVFFILLVLGILSVIYSFFPDKDSAKKNENNDKT